MNADINTTSASTGWLRTTLVGVTEQGICLVAVDAARTPIECDVMQTSEIGLLQLTVGDEVMVWLSSSPGQRGVIMGRVGPSAAANAGEGPDHLVLAATKNLTLQCGKGSITLRGDGKVLIKGKELVSSAEGMNRLKGGAVAIN